MTVTQQVTKKRSSICTYLNEEEILLLEKLQKEFEKSNGVKLSQSQILKMALRELGKAI